MKDWISVMVPCYNGESFLHRFFECLKNQTYRKIHIICVDDGSTDNSATIINHYKLIFEKDGRRFTYISQTNKGPAGAINSALKKIDSEYCAWIDVDDRIHHEYYSKMINYLVKHPDKEWAMCKGYMYEEDDLNRDVGTLGEGLGSGVFDEDLLLQRVNCTPGLYVVRSEALLESLPEDRHIFDGNKTGQNMQLLFPMAAKFGCPGRVDEFLFYYTIRKNSVSHVENSSLTREMEYAGSINETKYNTIKSCSFLTEPYKKFLLSKISIFELIWRVRVLHEFEGTNSYFRKISDQLKLKERIAGRKLLIWGFCDIGMWWYRNMRLLFTDTDTYYVDSDSSKCDNELVINTDHIKPDIYYIIIPIGLHQSIIEKLKAKRYSQMDYLYFEEELVSQYDGDRLIS